MAFSPHAEPQFGAAAHSLVSLLEAAPHPEDRAQLLLKLSRAVGDPWYPLYIKLLVVIGESAPLAAQAIVADAVAHGLQHGQTAGGTLGSWGVPVQMPAAIAAASRGFLRMSAARVLDPLAYLTVWFSQSTSRQPLPGETFEKSLTAVLRVFEASAAARSIYQAKLQADVASAAEGAYSATSLLRLNRLVADWKLAVPAHRIAAAVARLELGSPLAPQFGRAPGRLV
jgi:hypothetical protein